MIGDPWPEEPDEPLVDRYDEPDTEPDPEPDLDELTPDVPDESEADPELFRTFWSLVATINLGLFAAALGLMLIGFRGQWQTGGAVFLLGAGALAWAYYRYRAAPYG